MSQHHITLNMNQPPRLGLFEWTLLIILGIVWGASFFLAKVAVEQVPPLTLVMFRVVIAALALFVYFKITGRALPSGKALWLSFLIMGLINNVIPFSLLFWGQVHIASGLASILNATTPIFTVVVAHMFTADEKLNWHRLLGVGLGFIGVVVMLGGGIKGNSPALAMAACLGAALSYAFAGVFGRRFAAQGVGPARVALGQLTGSSIIMLPLVLLIDPAIALSTYTSSTIWSVLALAIVCTAVAYIMFFRILATGGATNLSLVTLLVPVSAIILGTQILGEQLTRADFIGMAFIALGLVATDGRLFKKRIN